MKLRFGNFLIIMALLVACQKGKKVESEATVHEDSVKICEELNTALKAEKINLDSTTDLKKLKNSNQEPPHLPKKSRDSENEGRIEKMLADFVRVASKLVKLADSNVVVFEEKEKIQNQLKLASHYLAEIYADRDWDAEDTYVASKQVDQAEMDIRFKRIHNNLKLIENTGLPTGAPEQKNIKPTDKIKLSELKKCSVACEYLWKDWIRFKDLSKRNNGFGLKGMEVVSSSADGLAGYYYHLGVAINKEIQRRGQR